MEYEVGERVYVDTWDIKAFGNINSIQCGIHVLVDGFDEPMYFQEHEVKKVDEDD